MRPRQAEKGRARTPRRHPDRRLCGALRGKGGEGREKRCSTCKCKWRLRTRAASYRWARSRTALAVLREDKGSAAKRGSGAASGQTRVVGGEDAGWAATGVGAGFKDARVGGRNWAGRCPGRETRDTGSCLKNTRKAVAVAKTCATGREAAHTGVAMATGEVSKLRGCEKRTGPRKRRENGHKKAGRPGLSPLQTRDKRGTPG